MGRSGGACSRCKSTQASLSTWCWRGGRKYSAVMSSGPRSTSGSTGSCHCGLGSIFGRLSSDESRSTSTFWCSRGGPSASSDEELRISMTSGAGCTRGCGTTRWTLRGWGRPKKVLMSRSIAALALSLLPLSTLLCSLLLSRCLTGLISAMARWARMDAVRRWREPWRRGGVPTMGPDLALSAKTRCNRGRMLQS